MTAEIAILNKSAVALAADSAGTITHQRGSKIYNTVNKIFELSSYDPVGIMIYGGLDFMGLPLEILVKEYRRELGRKAFDRISEYRDDFLDYLSNRVPCSPRDHGTNTVYFLERYLRSVAQRINEAIPARIRADGKFLASKIGGYVTEELQDELARVREGDYVDGFFSRPPPGIVKQLNEHVVKIAQNLFLSPLNAQNKRLLVRCSTERMLRAPLASGRTGIVIAGFGRKDICPSLEALETDGLILRKLKQLPFRSVDIGRESIAADMIGFAQDDMVSRFLNGVDKRYETYVKESVTFLLDDLRSQLVKASNVSDAEKDKAAEAISGVFSHLKGQLDTRLLQYRDREFKAPIVEMIRFMPKQELATLAQSMIELTSLQRRVSREQETVGGEVDVAVISKSEGFVWIKRKHYFTANLNPRFFERIGRAMSGAPDANA